MGTSRCFFLFVARLKAIFLSSLVGVRASDYNERQLGEIEMAIKKPILFKLGLQGMMFEEVNSKRR